MKATIIFLASCLTTWFLIYYTAAYNAKLNKTYTDWNTVKKDAMYVRSLDLSNYVFKELDRSIETLLEAKRMRYFYAVDVHWEDFDEKLFDAWSDLEILDLGHNYLTSIPKTIENCKKLRILNLANNYIEDLPSEVWNLPALEQLYLDHNVLNTLPENIDLPELKALYLNRCGLYDFSEKVNLPKLEELKMKDVNIDYFPKVFASLTRLKTLEISGAFLYEIPEDIVFPPNLEFLDLSCVGRQKLNIGKHFWKIETLQKSLKDLDLSNCNIDQIPEDITKFESLERLNLSFSNIEEVPDFITNMPRLKLILNQEEPSELNLETLPF